MEDSININVTLPEIVAVIQHAPYYCIDIDQIFHFFLFNIRNYSPEVSHIKQNGMEYLFCYIPPASNKILGERQEGKVNFTNNTVFFFFK